MFISNEILCNVRTDYNSIKHQRTKFINLN